MRPKLGRIDVGIVLFAWKTDFSWKPERLYGNPNVSFRVIRLSVYVSLRAFN